MRIKGKITRTPLSVAVPLAVLVGIALAFGSYWAIGTLVGTKADSPAAPIEIGRTALTLVAGIGGAVALVVAYRRQRDIEQGRFIERFGAAATQLGDPDVAVRIAGAYAMATAADESSNPARRQQCIDVLCGYLRLGFDPDQGTSNRTELVVKIKRGARPGIDGIEGSEEDTHFKFRANDRVVRETIVRIIASHLRPDAEISWSSNSFDFTGAYFSDAPFARALFKGSATSFASATFGEGETSFANAVFESDVSFERADFRCEETHFAKVRFGADVSFDKAIFNTGGVTPLFEKASFDGDAYFRDTQFLGIIAMFEHCKFKGERTIFARARFKEYTTFSGALFGGAYTTFDETQFNGYTEFNGVDFKSKRTTFEHVVFGGESTYFYQASFHGEETDFTEANFMSQTVNFERPGAWRNVMVAWDSEDVPIPACITPQEWPPKIEVPQGRTPLKRIVANTARLWRR